MTSAQTVVFLEDRQERLHRLSYIIIGALFACRQTIPHALAEPSNESSFSGPSNFECPREPIRRLSNNEVVVPEHDPCGIAHLL